MASIDLKLTQEFYRACTDRNYNERRIQFAPKENEYEELYNSNFLYAIDENDNKLEIMIFKKTKISIFKECFPLMKEYLAQKSNKGRDGGQLSMIDLYYVTVGLLLSSNENHSVINLHNEIVTNILESNENIITHLLLDPKTFICNELLFLQSLLNSNDNKLNKSSSLWTLFKRLFIYCADDEPRFEKLPHRFFIRTTMNAAELHFSNYYAWNFMRFMFNVSKVTLHCIRYKIILVEAEKYSYKHHTDASSWSAIADFCSIRKDALEHTCYEFNKYSKNLKLQTSTLNMLMLGPSSKDQLLSLSKWLWDNKVVAEVPYNTFRMMVMYNVRYWQEKELVAQLMGQVKIHCSLFEALKLTPNKIEVANIKGYLKYDGDGADVEDLTLYELLKQYFNWRCLLEWFDEFIKDKYVTIRSLD